jgi:hypothetical protein
MHRRLALLVLALSLPAAPASASSGLWATVNVCDTPAHPDAMGIRVAMPGNGERERMYARFRAQFLDQSDRFWASVSGTGRSPWVYVGSARYRSRQGGWTFHFDPPQGQEYLVRAVVDFEWRRRTRRKKGHRRRWVVTMRRRRATRGGIRGVDGGDPPWTSIGTCTIR